MRSVDMPEIERQLRLVDVTLADIEQGRTPLGQFVIGDTVYAAMRRRFAELQSTLRRATATTGQVGSLLYTDAALQKFQAPIEKLDQTIAQLQSGQGQMGRLLRDPAQYEQVRAMLKDLRKGIENARAADLMRSDDAYMGWIKTVAGVARQVDEVNASPALNSLDMYESWAGAAREMQQSLKDFRENPRKYLRLKVF
jgi:phospholipid/cholesterol/gamma-HCH transport system substrate-binding protein